MTQDLIRYWARLVNESEDQRNHNLNEDAASKKVKKHFEEVIGDIVKEQVEEYSKKYRSVRKYKDYLIDFILERSEEIIEDAVEMEEYETDEQLAFFIQQNMDNFDEQFMYQNPSDFDEEGNWDSEY